MKYLNKKNRIYQNNINNNNNNNEMEIKNYFIFIFYLLRKSYDDIYILK